MGLAFHEDALRASLRAVYGLDLRTLIESRSMHCMDLADLVAWLPPGCAFWLSFGGPVALTSEAAELRKVAYWLRVLDYRERGSKGPKPEAEDAPEYAHERRHVDDQMNRKAAAFLRRQERSMS